MTQLSNQTVENLRRVMGTLPSELPKRKTDYKTLDEALEITLEDWSNNPYKAIFVSCTSTWGDNDFQQKWPITTPEGKLEVIKAALCHKTLPQCKEAVMFTFRVKGVPRWLFDYHTQTTNFAFFMSIGCRDNNKIDTDIIKENFSEKDKEVFEKLKDLYEFALEDNGSWQSARAFLPQSYLHSYHFGQNLLSIVSTRGFHAGGRFKDNRQDQALLKLYKEIGKQVGQKFPLLGLYLTMMWEPREVVMDKIRNLTIETLEDKDFTLLIQN